MNKRQKEMARAEKQREKAAKRLQRKEQGSEPEPEMTLEEAAAQIAANAAELDY